MRLVLLLLLGSLCSCSAFLLDRFKTTPTTKKPSGGINVINIAVTQKSTPHVSQGATQPTTTGAATITTQATTKAVTEAQTEPSTVTEPVTDASTEPVTETSTGVTDAVSGSPTDAATEASTDEATKITKESTTASTAAPETPAPDTVRPPGACGGCKDSGNFFTLVANSDCRLFKIDGDNGGKPLACPASTRFDVNLCVCNHENVVTCGC